MFVLCKLVKLVKSKWRGVKKRFLLLPASEIRGRIMQIHVKVGIDIVEGALPSCHKNEVVLVM
jgi:hypothetical protein